MIDLAAALAASEGRTRLFPLPQFVFFPHAIQPLHIFEPRYRQMTLDALADDHLITMVLLRDGWEKDYEGRPPLYEIGCTGRILAPQQRPDGRWDFLLQGLGRVRIQSEPTTLDKLYRLAEVEVLAEQPLPCAEEADRLARDLCDHATTWFEALGRDRQMVPKLVSLNSALSFLCDCLAFHLPLPTAFKQELLEELDLRQRVLQLREYLGAHTPSPTRSCGRPFPPEFSRN